MAAMPKKEPAAARVVAGDPMDGDLQADYRVLEIGCGSGSRLLIFDQRVKFRTGSAAGVEPSPRLAARAERDAVLAGNARGSTVAASP